MRIGRFALAVIVVAACSEPSAPEDNTCPSAPVPLCLRPDSTVAVVGAAISDAATRSLGAMENTVAKAAFLIELNALAEAIVAGNMTRAATAVDRSLAAAATARQQLTTYPGDAPDITAIELALIQTALAVK